MKHNCIACKLDQAGVKAKNAPPHSCAKSSKKYVEPDTKIFNVQGHKILYHKILLYDKINYADKAELYRLESQYLNGYKVKRYSELWIPTTFSIVGEPVGPIRYIWVNDYFYTKLVFV